MSTREAFLRDDQVVFVDVFCMVTPISKQKARNVAKSIEGEGWVVTSGDVVNEEGCKCKAFVVFLRVFVVSAW
jgi:hypothetical protein